MMQIVADLHTHTIASTHAYSTLLEMVTAAKAGGLQGIATTDHAPGMPDAPHEWHFINLRALPNWHNGFLILKGVEANIMDDKGTLDMKPEILQKLDWVIASMHVPCVAPMSYEQATACWLQIAQNPLVDMIGHSEQHQYPYDYDFVTKAFAQNNKVVEMNAGSAISRPGNEENLRNLALACKRNGVRIAVNSDAHSVFNLFNGADVLAMLQDIDFPQELVVNSSMQLLLAELARHGKNITPP